MNNLEIALKIALKEITEAQRDCNVKCNSYKEFIEEIYNGDAKQFRNDLEFSFNQYRNSNNNFEFTDDMEIINRNEIISYKKFVNLIKKSF